MTRTTALLTAACAAASAPTAALADISLFLRDSAAENDVFVGAGGAIDRSDVRVTETAFVGPLTLNDTASVEVTENDGSSNGRPTAPPAFFSDRYRIRREVWRTS